MGRMKSDHSPGSVVEVVIVGGGVPAARPEHLGDVRRVSPRSCGRPRASADGGVSHAAATLAQVLVQRHRGAARLGLAPRQRGHEGRSRGVLKYAPDCFTVKIFRLENMQSLV